MLISGAAFGPLGLVSTVHMSHVELCMSELPIGRAPVA